MMQTKTDTIILFGLTCQFDVLVKPIPIPCLSLEICRVITVLIANEKTNLDHNESNFITPFYSHLKTALIVDM